MSVSALEFASSKLKWPKESKALSFILEAVEKGLTVGETCFLPEVWADKEATYWKVDRAFGAFEEFQRLAQKREKIFKDLESRKSPVADNVLEAVKKASTQEELDEVYRPYKRKKKTKATLAREAGLQAFAQEIVDQAQIKGAFETGLETEAKKYIQPALGFITYDVVLKGVQDILVEQKINEHQELRKSLLEGALAHAKVVVKPGEKFTEGCRYAGAVKAPVQGCNYYLNSNNYERFPNIKKGWEEGYLRVTLEWDMEPHKVEFEKAFLGQVQEDQSKSELADFLKGCARKALEIHVLPSVTTEVFDRFFKVSEHKTITKLKIDYISLLTTPSMGEKPVLSVFEKGEHHAVLVFVSHTGDFVSSTTFDLSDESVVENIKSLLEGIVNKVSLGAIVLPLAGKASDGKTKKLQRFFARALEELKKSEDIPVVLSQPRGLLQFVNSSEAKFGLTEKLNNQTLAALRLGRRVQDALYEYADHLPSSLFEIPGFINKAVVDKELSKTLSYYLCSFGIEPSKLGLGAVKSMGWFTEESSDEKPVDQVCAAFKEKALGWKEKRDLGEFFSEGSVERYAKFFKFSKAVNVLDRVRVSISDFSKIKDFAKEKEISLLKGPVSDLKSKLEEKDVALLGEAFAQYLGVELANPFKDFRKPYKVFSFSKVADDLSDMKEDHLYWGVVTKFSSFGAFVDLGVGVPGLIHLSELSGEYLADPRKVLKLDQWVLVKAIKVDVEGKKLSLSKKQAEDRPRPMQKGKGSFRPKRSSSHGSSHRPESGSKHSSKPRGKGGGMRSGGSKRQQGGGNRKPFNNAFAALGDWGKTD